MKWMSQDNPFWYLKLEPIENSDRIGLWFCAVPKQRKHSLFFNM